jgi:ABC-type Zn uptake system ZnuABC Zn-binding protein ZnuA
MKKLILVFLALCSFSVVALGATSPSQPLKVIVGTSLIRDIVYDLTSGRAQTLSISTAQMCPGQDDLTAKEVIFAKQANLMLIQHFQLGMPAAMQLKKAASPNMKFDAIEMHGNWMQPDIQALASDAIAKKISETKPEWKDDIAFRAKIRRNEIQRAGLEAEEKLASLKGKAVIASVMQADFLRWAGLDVVSTYGAHNDLTPKSLTDAMQQAKGKNPFAVIDNLQSGAYAGLPIAQELQIKHITLSNFPGEGQNYFSLLRSNIDKLMKIAH